jgi:hypothetical protein
VTTHFKDGDVLTIGKVDLTVLRTPEHHVSLMDNLDLPHPKLMDIAVPANQACGPLNN